MAKSQIGSLYIPHQSRPARARNSACADVALIWLVGIRGNVQTFAGSTLLGLCTRWLLSTMSVLVSLSFSRLSGPLILIP